MLSLHAIISQDLMLLVLWIQSVLEDAEEKTGFINSYSIWRIKNLFLRNKEKKSRTGAAIPCPCGTHGGDARTLRWQPIATPGPRGP